MKFIAFAYPIILLMDIIVFINFYNWQQESIYEFEQRQLDIQVNYAVEAATQEMLSIGTHIDTDYADWGRATLEPQIALDTFTTVLMKNLGYSNTKENRDALILDHVPFFIVAGYDGYYVYGTVAETVTVDGVEQLAYPKRWTPKLPYAMKSVKTEGNINTVFFNLSNNNYDAIWNGNYYEKINYDRDKDVYPNSYFGIDKGTNTSSPYTPNGTVDINSTTGRVQSWDLANTQDRDRCVNDTLTYACNAALYAALEGNMEKEWFLPSTFSEWSQNRPVTSPSVLVYINRNNTSSVYDVSTFGIGGAKIDEATFFICYKNEQGDKVYTYATNRAKVEARGLTVLYTATSMEDAAKNGYYYDLTYLRR